MSFTLALTPAEQLVVEHATPTDALVLWRSLRDLYLARRGPASTGSSVPAVLMADAIDLVNAYERLAAPLAGALAVGAPALWAAWRQSYARVFAVVSAAPRLYAPLPAPEKLWHGLLAPFAEHLAAFATQAKAA